MKRNLAYGLYNIIIIKKVIEPYENKIIDIIVKFLR